MWSDSFRAQGLDMTAEEHIDVQMLCNAFVQEVVVQITDIKAKSPQMERSNYEDELVDTVFKASETMKEKEGFPAPDELARIVQAAETLLAFMPKKSLALREPVTTLLFDTAALIKKAQHDLPSVIAH